MRISIKTYDGKLKNGTAYFFNLKVDDNQVVPILVTNKHVIENANQGEFLVHEAILDANNNPIPSDKSCSLHFTGDFHLKWYSHPDETIDLCAMLFQPLKEKAEREEKNFIIFL